jgi:endo-1,4-beta-xylanase
MVQNISTYIPREFKLYQNYPNPCKPITKIRFDIPKKRRNLINTKLFVFDIFGREITMPIDAELEPGSYKIDLDASKLNPGLYFYKLIAGDFTDVKQMIVI